MRNIVPGLGGEKYASNENVSYYSALTFAFDLETCFKVTAHPLPKGILQVKYEPHWPKARDDMLRTRNLGQTNEETDQYRA